MSESHDQPISVEIPASISAVETPHNADSGRRGYAPLKPQYIIPKEPVKEETLSHLSEAVERQGDSGRLDMPDSESSASATPQPGVAESNEGDDKDDGGNGHVSKRQRFKENRRKKGMTKDRKVTRHVNDAVELCLNIARGEECSYGEKCRINHDVEKYLASKEKDLGERCVNFDLFGVCPYGYKCRFLDAHMTTTPERKLVKDQEKRDRTEPTTLNILPHDMTIKLRKFDFDYSRSEKFLKEHLAEQAAANKSGKNDDDDDAEDNAAATGEKDNFEDRKIAVPKPRLAQEEMEEVTQDDTPDVPLRACEKKKIDFRGKTYLAPLTTVGNLPFRRICKEYGVDITCGEMALAQNIVQGHKSELALLRRHASEDLFGVQITGNKVDVITKACDVINQTCDVDFVDLNMGCPIDQMFNSGCGSGLMGRMSKVKSILKGMQSVLDVPVTVKYRMAIYDKKPIGTNLTPRFHLYGAALGTLHGRSRQQRYTRLADWDYIQACTEVDRGTPGTDDYMPLFGNGDIMGYTDYYEHLEKHNVDGCMIGRGALIKPWIFEEIKSKRHWDISSNERFDMMKRFCDYGLEHWGSDTHGVNQTRRFLLEWQSFLYRYIPAGLLEVLPQKINERPPPFVGRDDLETLMASSNVQDWIKLSEMILGPAPAGFRFDPKHKANSANVEG
ncbi:tRNA-dihydrouridine(47) synthase [NAD(P)(+)]-like protein [Actinomortierella ambigua]|uniref:tRNA-dihydrouridine(47) synthase [NAD(P)(+)] n=1 Tax=Actinomortierella ambigua TaxID=1343610 RepID=A0A9P6PTU0_9FUNG|nr:tRNA-dihydrouridine(47) synthase [NAD(P)(+)]-like protein [Actinomortierella ambigua]